MDILKIVLRGCDGVSGVLVLNDYGLEKFISIISLLVVSTVGGS